ncbi:MAG: V-type ATP synthase subunit I [Bacillota bacterium]
MKKVHLLALLDEKEPILQKLQRLGMVEIRDIETEGAENAIGLSPMYADESQAKLEAKLSDMDASIKFLSEYSEEKKGFLEQKPVFTYAELMEMQSELEPAEGIIEEAKALENRLVEIRSRRIRLQNLKTQIKPWLDLKVRVEDVKNTAHTYMAAGFIIPEEDMDINGRLEQEGCLAAVEKIHVTKEQTAVFVMAHTDGLQKTLEILREAGWNETSFEGLAGLPADIYAAYEQEEKDLDKDAEDITQKAKELSKNIPTAEHARDYLATILERRAVDESMARTGSTFVLNGWVMADHTEALEKALSEITNNYHIQFLDPEEGDEIPSAVRNPKALDQFEAVTDMYSPPSPKGVVDPAPILGPFFALFYGMMVSDAAYGVVIALVSFVLYKWRKPTGTLGKILRILTWGGVSTIFWGLMFGGVFGITIPALLVNPMTQPLEMLGLCFGLGFIHIITGMVVKIYMDFKRKQYVDAICDQVLWIFLITGLPMMALPATSMIGTILAILGAGGILLTAGRHQKNIVKKFTSGLLALYNITGYLADVLSYSRLFALGLATGVIASVFNTIGSMVGGSIVGYVFMVIILVVGHIFNIAINAMGAFVHSSRLQYIEFFGKFYESGGRRFKPLVLSTRYIRVDR